MHKTAYAHTCLLVTFEGYPTTERGIFEKKDKQLTHLIVSSRHRSIVYFLSLKDKRKMHGSKQINCKITLMLSRPYACGERAYVE